MSAFEQAMMFPGTTITTTTTTERERPEVVAKEMEPPPAYKSMKFVLPKRNGKEPGVATVTVREVPLDVVSEKAVGAAAQGVTFEEEKPTFTVGETADVAVTVQADNAEEAAQKIQDAIDAGGNVGAEVISRIEKAAKKIPWGWVALGVGVLGLVVYIGYKARGRGVSGFPPVGPPSIEEVDEIDETPESA